MIKKLSLLSLLAPVIAFAQEVAETADEVAVEVVETAVETIPAVPSYVFSTGGLVFMAVTWAIIIGWNVICFSKILKTK